MQYEGIHSSFLLLTVISAADAAFSRVTDGKVYERAGGWDEEKRGGVQTALRTSTRISLLALGDYFPVLLPPPREQ